MTLRGKLGMVGMVPGRGSKLETVGHPKLSSASVIGIIGPLFGSVPGMDRSCLAYVLPLPLCHHQIRQYASGMFLNVVR